MGTMDWLLNNIGNATWGRWVPGAASQLEGGVDVPEKAGTPIYALGTGPLTGAGYFYHGGPYFSQQETGAGANPGYGVVTEDVPGVGQIYYQHIDLAPGLPFCQSGNCNGYQVQAGQLLGYSRQNPGEVEVGINSTWGGIWGTNQNPNLWQTDPRNSLVALAQQNSGASPQGNCPLPTVFGLNPCTPGVVGHPPASQPTPCPYANVPVVGGVYCFGWNLEQTATNNNTCAPWDINCVVKNLGPVFQTVGIFLVGALMFAIGFYLLASRAGNGVLNVAINGAEIGQGGESSGSAPAPSPAPAPAAPASTGTQHQSVSAGGKTVHQSQSSSGVQQRAGNVEKLAKVAAVA